MVLSVYMSSLNIYLGFTERRVYVDVFAAATIISHGKMCNCQATYVTRCHGWISSALLPQVCAQ